MHIMLNFMFWYILRFHYALISCVLVFILQWCWCWWQQYTIQYFHMQPLPSQSEWIKSLKQFSLKLTEPNSTAATSISTTNSSFTITIILLQDITYKRCTKLSLGVLCRCNFLVYSHASSSVRRETFVLWAFWQKVAQKTTVCVSCEAKSQCWLIILTQTWSFPVFICFIRVY